MLQRHGESKQPQRLSKKELARQFRHEAYLRAKEYRKTDPRQIAMTEKLKEQQREAYQKAKERNKAYRTEQKKVAKEKTDTKKDFKQKKLRAMVVSGSTIKKPSQKPEPHVLTKLDQVSVKTLRMMDNSMRNLAQGITGKPIALKDLKQYVDIDNG